MFLQTLVFGYSEYDLKFTLLLLLMMMTIFLFVCMFFFFKKIMDLVSHLSFPHTCCLVCWTERAATGQSVAVFDRAGNRTTPFDCVTEDNKTGFNRLSSLSGQLLTDIESSYFVVVQFLDIHSRKF